MSRIILSAIITVVCIASFIFVPCDIITGTQQHSKLLYALCYSWSHVNIWHLAINLYALWLFRPRFSTCLIAFASAFLASLILSTLNSQLLTLNFVNYVGLSGFLFAAVARWYVSWSRPIWFPVFINLAMLFINIAFSFLSPFKGESERVFFCCFAWHIHLTSFFLSYIFWLLYYKKKRG